MAIFANLAGLSLIVGAQVVFALLVNFAVSWRSRRAFRPSAQPEFTSSVEVIGKRVAVSGRWFTTRQSHFVTFELPDGRRRELTLSASGYGQLAEGDFGTLAAQGDACLGFQRQILR